MDEVKGTVLVTGASGFIGRRLVRALLAEGLKVRCMARGRGELPPEADAAVADLLDASSLSPAFEGVHTAYYLVHSMAGGRAGFEERDRLAASNFVAAAERAGIQRAIYLGGLGETGDNLSEHLASRREVATILQSASFPVTVLRAAVIIGAGGASFEMIRSLVERLPLMVVPRWVTTRCQPIAVDDVIGYLAGCLRVPETAGEVLDVGGPDILSYREMMERFASIEGKKLLILPVPFLTPKLSSYWVGLITPVKPSISMPLIEGLANEVICRSSRIRELIPLRLTPYDDAVRAALREEKEMAAAGAA
jgi:uncharacterized protein YbjT (DUF2867 family)